jgi:hypothetical protein
MISGNPRSERARKALLKSSKKSEKKACLSPASSITREINTTNRPNQPFKKSFKKVKKKLVSALKLNNPAET